MIKRWEGVLVPYSPFELPWKGYVMKQRCVIFLAALFCAWSLTAAVAPGQNILVNGDFEAEQMDFPPFWTATNRDIAGYESTIGPQSTGAVILKAPEGEKVSVSIRQLGLSLVAGETYKISAWVKTNDSQQNHGVFVHNSGWFSEWAVNGWKRAIAGNALSRL